MIDSRASFHAKLYRKSFITCKDENFGIVKRENYGRSKVICLKVVTNLGYNLILQNVLQVQDLRMNLISPGDLDDKSYTSKFIKGT